MTEKPHILLVDDDELVLRSLEAVLVESGFKVTTAETGEVAVAALERGLDCDVLLCDMNLPVASGMQVMQRAKELRSDLPVIIITAYGSVDNAVQAMRLGAKDYLAKPVDDFELIQKVRRAVREQQLTHENRSLKNELERVRGTDAVIARHPSMHRVLTTAEAVAATRATVLIHGESGTGKTILARAIHAMSNRSGAAFIEVSCGSLPDPLLESELFGYERGAFTGADKERQGKFEVADGGTLFLDEIANATPALQVKLLRAMQDRVFERLGGNESLSVDVRMILATNADLEDMVKRGSFREDLYYRINVVNIWLPPLRDRQSDIPLLVDHFLAKYRAEHGKAELRIDPALLSGLMAYPWPGNVRELENVVEHMVVLARSGTLELSDLPPRYRRDDAEPTPGEFAVQPLKQAMEAPEREYIRNVLRMNSGNRQKTADMLKVNRTTLFNKMKKYNLFSEDMHSS